MMRWVHELLPKHDRNMALAESAVEWAGYYKRRGDAVTGWEYVTSAIGSVVECGCPREWWPEAVRGVVTNETD